ncbi:MAG: hypothetical protein AAFY98_10810, partial [Verrucomicrobiota bacterium]
MSDFADNYSVGKWVRSTVREWREMRRSERKPIERKHAAIIALFSVLFAIWMHFFGAQSGSLGMFIEI